MYKYEDKICFAMKRHSIKYLVKLQTLKVVAMKLFAFLRDTIYLVNFENKSQIDANSPAQLVKDYVFYNGINVNKTSCIHKQTEKITRE